MQNYDRMSTLFLVAVAIAICVESIRLGPGSLSAPASGLLPLGCGLILGILGLIGFVLTFKSAKGEKKEVLWERGTRWGRMISALASLISYAFLIDLLGFRLITFLWMGFMCRGLARMRWKTVIFVSVVTTISCSFLFQYYLGIRFPRGIFGF